MNTEIFIKLVSKIVKTEMLCQGRLVNLAHHLLQTSILSGDIVEFGCNKGYTAAFMSYLIDKPLWLYDSFDGLPDRLPQDEGSLDIFQRGSMKVDESYIKQWFSELNLKEPNIIKCWFDKVTDDMLPNEIAFAHLDGDLYSSIRDSLQLVYPRMVKGAVCIIDDYGWRGTAGVKIAADEFMSDKPERIIPMCTGNVDKCHAIFIKNTT